MAFPHQKPKDTTAHRRVFGESVHFGQPRAELVFATSDLERPLASHDPSVLEAFVEEEERLSLAAAHAATSTKERVRHLLHARMRVGDASLAAIARVLGLSTRSLQRKLLEESAPFSALVEDVRASEAKRYVVERKLSFGEIAFRLGFSQQSAFFRAFNPTKAAFSLAEAWDARFFHDMTFERLYARERAGDSPRIILNGTSYNSGRRFAMTTLPASDFDYDFVKRLLDDLVARSPRV